MNKIGKRILAAAVASSGLVTPVFADPSVDDLKKSKESAQNEVSSLQTQLNTVVGKITELESQLSSKGEEIIQAQSDLEDAEAEEQKQYADMKVRIKYMYEAGDQSAVESLVGSEDFSDMVNKAEYVSNVHNYDRQKLQEYVETKQKISDLKDQLEEEQSQLESMQTEYESQESKLDNLIASKQAEVSDLDQQIEEAERKAAEEELKRQQEERQLQQKQQDSRLHRTGIILPAHQAIAQVIAIREIVPIKEQATMLQVMYQETQCPVRILHLENRMYGERQDRIPLTVQVL